MHSFEIVSRSNCAAAVLFRSLERFNTHTKTQYWDFERELWEVFKKLETRAPAFTMRRWRDAARHVEGGLQVPPPIGAAGGGHGHSRRRDPGKAQRNRDPAVRERQIVAHRQGGDARRQGHQGSDSVL